MYLLVGIEGDLLQIQFSGSIHPLACLADTHGILTGRCVYVCVEVLGHGTCAYSFKLSDPSLQWVLLQSLGLWGSQHFH